MGKQSNGTTEARLDKIDGRLAVVEREVHGINVTTKVVGAGVGLLLLFLIGLVAFAGKSVIKDIARDVYREETAYHTRVQSGTLSNANMLRGAREFTSTHPTAVVSFRWDLKPPVDASKVIDYRAKSPKLPTEIKIDCEIEDDGKACVFTLKGPADLIKSLNLPVAATVLIDVAN